MAGSLALAAATQMASADVTVRITGSTAFRAATQTAISHIFSSLAGYTTDTGNLTSANYAIFKGTVAGVSGTTIIKCDWSGAVAGVRDVSQGNAINYYPDSTAVAVAPGNTLAISGNSVSEVPDLAMTDNLQASTPYTSPVLSGGGVVGIVPFAWVASTSAPADLTNITPQLARALFKGGLVSAALFTNNNAEASDQVGGSYVYAMGRDPLSGTRLNAVAEPGIGLTTLLNQYAGATTGTSAGVVSFTSIALTGSDAVYGAVGNNGQGSGGTLADQMRYVTTSAADNTNSLPAAPLSFITYLGETDSYRAVAGVGSSINVSATTTNNAKYLSYNGVSAWGGRYTTFATGNVTSGNNTITLSGTETTAGLIVGQAVKASGANSGFIPGDSIVASITDSTHFVISSPTGGTISGSGTIGTVTTTNLLPTPIRNGTYTFWGYEHIMWNPANVLTDKLTVATALKNQITNTDYYVSGLANDTNMRVQRSGFADGGTVSQKY